MASKLFYLIVILFVCRVESASLLEKSYDYVVNLGKSIAPSFLSMVDCLGEDDFWSCAKERAGKVLESWEKDNQEQRKLWQEAADSEVASSGRAIEELPSKLGKEVEESLMSVADLVQHGMARALSRHHSDGGEATITISTSDKKKKKKNKKKPSIHVHPMMVKAQESDRGFGNIQSWVIGGKSADDSYLNGENHESSAINLDSSAKDHDLSTKNHNSSAKDHDSSVNGHDSSAKDHDSSEKDHDSSVNSSGVPIGARKGRGIVNDFWELGEKAIDAVAEHAVESDNSENGIEDKSSFEEQRGKKKKKKKAILKLLILGAVLKAKIGTLLQILSFKLQVKFFIIALIGLGINLARFWLDLKKSHHQQPQKVIYYEHAQHQHHYDHEEEPGWGPWSRSMDPEESEVDVDVDPFRAQIDRNIQSPYQYNRPLIKRV